jgi:uncharacterized protein
MVAHRETTMRYRVALAGLFTAGLLSAGTAHAQGIDCTKARSPTEKGICGSPALLSLDHQVAVAYGDALARQPDQRATMRTELLQWLKQRDTTCNVPAAAMERCLSGQLTARLAALAPPAATPTPTVATAPVRPGQGGCR